eukprot:6107789-Pleurochrysis_carterae.AAC.1
MHALYKPHRAQDVEPNDLIAPDEDTRNALHFHLDMVVKSGGAPVSVALFKRKHRLHQPYPHIVCAYADAATDSVPPGIGGYCHGAF